MTNSADEPSERFESIQTKLFAMLLAGHALAEARATRKAKPGAERFRSLLLAFSEALGRAALRDARRAAGQVKTFAALVQGHEESLQRWLDAQRDTAESFDLLEVLGLTRNEVRHTRMLAWLLDRNIRKAGTHAQGAVGFRLLLQELGLPPGLADSAYWVRREVAGNEARVDIEIAATGRFLIHIEAKIRAREGPLQTDREWADLRRRAAALGVPAFAEQDCIFALFLTPTGEPPTNPNFRVVSWRQIAQVLDRFAAHARPPHVKLFATHYARSLRRFVAIEAQEQAEATNA